MGSNPALPDDLLGVISIYATFEPTISLLSIARGLISSDLYPANSQLWRNKSQLSTAGLEHDSELITKVGYRHYYRVRTRDTYGPYVEFVSLDLGSRASYRYTNTGAYLVAIQRDYIAYVDSTRTVWFGKHRSVSPIRCEKGYPVQLGMSLDWVCVLTERGDVWIAKHRPGSRPIPILTHPERGAYTGPGQGDIPVTLPGDQIVALRSWEDSLGFTVLARSGMVYSVLIGRSIDQVRIIKRASSVISIEPNHTSIARNGTLTGESPLEQTTHDQWLTATLRVGDTIVSRHVTSGSVKLAITELGKIDISGLAEHRLQQAEIHRPY